MRNRIFIIAATLAFVSCSALTPDRSGGFDSIDDYDDGHGMIVLGSKLENPFSIENMTKALQSLYPETKADRVPMNPTDVYVRVLPRNQDEFDALARMGILMLDHPVDFEVIREGDYYHDPEIENGKITWQYAVVKKGFNFPSGYVVEKLDDCYIPDNDLSTKGSGIDWEAVERQAYVLSGNASMLTPETRDSERSQPEGTITIEDDKLGVEGVKGVMVSCNSFVKFAHAYTDEGGHYKMTKSFSTDPRYRLVFKNKAGFSIGFNLLLVPASCSSLGKNPSSGHDVEITAESERKLFSRCAVNNAAYAYYKSCESGKTTISRPPANLRIWLFQRIERSSAIMMQQGSLVDASLLTKYLGEYSSLIKMFLPDITLGLKNKDDYSSIYADTVHELAHASHFMLAGRGYWEAYIKHVLMSFVTSGFVVYGVGTEENAGHCEIAEMWAYYASNSLHKERYFGDATTFGTSYWFHPQIFMQLEERGLDRARIFAALTSDITTRALLQKKLTSLYPEFKNEIKQAFGRYN